MKFVQSRIATIMTRAYGPWDDSFDGVRYGLTQRFRSVPCRFLPPNTSGSSIVNVLIVMLILSLAVTTGDATSEPDGQMWVGQASDSGAVNYVDFSQDGKTLVTVDSNCDAAIWDVETGRNVETQPGAFEGVRSLAYCPNGKILAGGKLDSTVVLWDCESLTVCAVLRAHTSSVNALAYSPDGGTLASVEMNGLLNLWQMTAGYPVTCQRRFSTGIASIAFSRCGRSLAISCVNRDLKILRLTSPGDPTLIGRFMHAPRALAFSPEGRTLAAACSFSPCILLWDLRASHARAMLSASTQGASALAYSPDGQTLVSAGNDGTRQVWDVAGWRTRKIAKGHSGRYSSR